MNDQAADRNRFSIRSRLRALWPPASRSGSDPPHDSVFDSTHLLWASIVYFRSPQLPEITPERGRDTTPLR
jgi:hypothetical protein